MHRSDRFRTICKIIGRVALFGFVIVNGCKVSRTSLLGFSIRGTLPAAGLSAPEAAARILAARIQIQDCDHCGATGELPEYRHIDQGRCRRCQGATIVVQGVNVGVLDDDGRGAVVVAALARLETETRPQVVKGLAALIGTVMAEATPETRRRAYNALRRVMFRA